MFASVDSKNKPKKPDLLRRTDQEELFTGQYVDASFEKQTVGKINSAAQATELPGSTEAKHLSSPHNFGKIAVYPPVVLQAKLAVNTAGDKYEQEADHIADKIMGMNGTVITANDEDEGKNLKHTAVSKNITPVLQAKSDSGAAVSNSVSNKIVSSQGGGNMMDNNTQSFMSGRFGTDFSKVNIHTDSESEQMNAEINARAFTVGNDIYFSKGEYQPGSSKGKLLLAHELSHVLQQKGSDKKIQKDDPAPDAAAIAEAKKVADLTTKIKAIGIIGVENGDATFTSAELELVNKALSGLPVNDKAAIKGAKIVRVTSLGAVDASYSNTQGYDDTSVTEDQKIELSDSAFGTKPADESIRLITHEVGHAIATMPYRVATAERDKEGLKSLKLINEANTASDEFTAANDENTAAVGENNDAFTELEEANKGGDKDTIAAARTKMAAKKAAWDKAKAARAAKEAVYNTKKASSDTQEKVLATKEAASQAKIANIDDFKTDAATKLATMQSSYTAANSTINSTDADSADYRTSLTTAEDAIKKFYDENVTADVDEATAGSAKTIVDKAIEDRNNKRDALNKANPKNTVVSATAALETAQDNCFRAATMVAFNKSMNLATRRFYDFVIANAIPSNLTTYAAQNWPHKPEEFYAEAYSYFVTKPTELETFSKLLYDWFKAGKYK